MLQPNSTLFGLLAATGTRLSEPIGLDRPDVYVLRGKRNLTTYAPRGRVAVYITVPGSLPTFLWLFLTVRGSGPRSGFYSGLNSPLQHPRHPRDSLTVAHT